MIITNIKRTIMKNLSFLIAILLFCAVTLFAQAPEKFTYQAVVRNASNALVANTQVGVRVNILQGSATGNAVYSESHVVISNTNGLVTLNIGSGSVLHGSFGGIDWSDGPYFLKTDIDPNGGNDYTITSTQQLLSVPYALYAKDAGNGFSGDYNDLVNVPQIPQIPADISAFNNDAGYITGYTETDPQYNAWNKDYNDLINKPTIPTVPTNVSAFMNDAGYITMDSVPTIPTNVSAFTNDAGYLTHYTETDPQYNAWDKDYNDLINTPVIPTVPTNVSAFNNDAGYITMDSVPTVPTNVSAFVNDAGYLTNFTEQQVLSISNDTLFLTGGSFVKLPAGFDGDYNSLINQPVIPDAQVNSDWDATNGAAQILNKPEIPTVPTDVSAFNNDVPYLIEETQTLADVTEQGNSAGGRQLKDVSDPTESYDAVNLRTLTMMIDSVMDKFQRMQYQQEAMQREIDSLKEMMNSFHPDNSPNNDFVCGTSTVSDHEGNVYATVQIGSQCWMRDNLRTTTSPTTGTYLIPSRTISSTYTGKMARWYNNDSATYAPMNYGLLYNWNAAVDTFNTAYGETSVNDSSSRAVSVSFSDHRRGICPTGWHLPSKAEWTQLTNYVSSQSEYVCGDTNINIAKALADSVRWYSSTTTCAVGNDLSANNATGFGALPTGSCDNYFSNNCRVANFWSSTTQLSTNLANSLHMYYYKAGSTNGRHDKNLGYSVRCLRDSVPAGDDTPTPQDTTVAPADTVVIDSKSCPTAPTVTDHEGNVYATVQIGDQCWMRDNLRTTTSPSTGTYIVNNEFTSDPDIVAYTYTGKMARWYNNDSAQFAPLNYGLLYNWNAAVDTFNTAYGELSVNTSALSVSFSGHRRGICPVGWHIPTDAEWNTMERTVSGPDWQTSYETTTGRRGTHAGKLAGGNDWITSSTTGAPGNYSNADRNVSGFSAVPAGSCLGTSFNRAGYVARFFWSSSQYASNPSCAYGRELSYNDAGVGRYAGHKGYGFSVRCLRDSVPADGDNPTPQDTTVAPTDTVVIDSKSCTAAPTVTDHEGNVYATVQIGSQCWMRDNLRTTTSPSTGTYIVNNEFVSGMSVAYTYTGKMARWYYNDSATYAPMNYGLLYNWNAAVDTFNTAYGELSVDDSASRGVFVIFSGHRRGICPAGWHLPSDLEWTQLTNYVSSQSEYVCGDANINIAKALAATTDWNTCNEICTPGNDPSNNNATGFGALPAGEVCLYSNDFGKYANFWSATTFSNGGAIIHFLSFGGRRVNRMSDAKRRGFSVRCLRDSIPAGGDTLTPQDTTVAPADTVVIDSKSCPAAPTVTDHEGNVYATVQIGNQCWMRDNLRTTTSPSTGTYLVNSQFTSGTNVAYSYTGKMARWYNNDSAIYAPMNYGLLYNWNAAVDTFNTAYGETSINDSSSRAVSVIFSGHRRGICPVGWHIPTDAEWNTMERTVSGPDWQTSYETTTGRRGTHAGKLAGGNDWITSSTTGAPGNYSNADRNVSGFSAVPAGYRHGAGSYDAGYGANFCSSSQYTRGLSYDYAGVSRFYNDKHVGRSVRCLRDSVPAGGDSPTPQDTTVAPTDTVVIDSKSCPAAPTVTDHEGNVYATVQIGDQCWMRDNLRTTTSPSTGTYIVNNQFSSDTEIATTYTGKMARWYNNDSTTYAPMNYGLLYNWNAAVDTFNTAYGETSINDSSSRAVVVIFSDHRRGICPAGWHLPSDAEWTQLTNYMSSQSEYVCGDTNINIAKALAATTGWYSSTDYCAVGNDRSLNNATGFGAVPAGYWLNSSFIDVGYLTSFWSSSQSAYYPYDIRGRYLFYHDAGTDWYLGVTRGFSVRCLRD